MRCRQHRPPCPHTGSPNLSTTLEAHWRSTSNWSREGASEDWRVNLSSPSSVTCQLVHGTRGNCRVSALRVRAIPGSRACGNLRTVGARPRDRLVGSTLPRTDSTDPTPVPQATFCAINPRPPARSALTQLLPFRGCSSRYITTPRRCSSNCSDPVVVRPRSAHPKSNHIDVEQAPSSPRTRAPRIR